MSLSSVRRASRLETMRFPMPSPAGEEPPPRVGYGVRCCCRWTDWGPRGCMKKKIPLGWVLDTDGNETEDPSKVAAILPAAGPKGSALAIVMDVLCGPLGGGTYGYQ